MSKGLQLYSEQLKSWPEEGKHFLAHRCGEDILTLYQAYKPSIAKVAVEKQSLSASSEFSERRMTWVKPGFLWMMYRSGWASKSNQERILAINVRASWLFEALKKDSVVSTVGKTRDHNIVVQWDPDHDWNGAKKIRKAIQIGLRGRIAAEFAAGASGPAVVSIEDITSFVENMRDNVVAVGKEAVEQHLLVPVEEVWDLDDELQDVLCMR